MLLPLRAALALLLAFAVPLLAQEPSVRMDLVIYPGEGHSFFGIRRSLERFYDTTIEVDKFLGSLGWVQGPPTLTREWVQKLAAGLTMAPNKLAREKAAKEATEK